MNECPRCGRLESHTEICALQGEIERLRHDIERHIAMASELATENEGLRAELAECKRQRPASTVVTYEVTAPAVWALAIKELAEALAEEEEK